MSRTTTLLTSYLQAVIFGALGVRCVMSWLRDRDQRSVHLAWAAGLFATSSALGAVTTTFIDATKNESAPRWESILAGVIIYVSVYFFLLFLSDFIKFPVPIHALIILATAANIVFAFIERPDLRLDPKTFQIVKIPGVHNPISYRGYISYVLLYLAVVFGVLAVSFLVYGVRNAGLARFRMITIGGGFLLLCIAIGVIPRILFGHPSSQTNKNIQLAVTYLALLSAPLLLVGFGPPKLVRGMFPETEPQPVR